MATTERAPAPSPDGSYDRVATPVGEVTAVPAGVPSTVKLTVAPAIGAPPLVCVSVAVKVTGPDEPKGTEVGLGAARASVVPIGPTTNVPAVVVGPLPPPWQLLPRPANTVNG